MRRTLATVLPGARIDAPPLLFIDSAGKGWERISRTVDRDTYPRMAEIAPYAAKLGWDEVFWTGFEQAGGSMNLFADKQTARTMF